VSLNDSIRYVTALGALSLGFWGGLAGRRSGSSGWRLVLAVLAGLAVGGLVLALQIVLQPGKAASGGGL
jgi:VanZ family protein